MTSCPQVVPVSAREHVWQGVRSEFNIWKGGRAELQPGLLSGVLLKLLETRILCGFPIIYDALDMRKDYISMDAVIVQNE